MTLDILSLFSPKEPQGSDDRGTTDPSTRSAGAQGREEREATRQGTEGQPQAQRGGKAGETQMVTMRLRRPIVEAVEEAVKGSPIEFGNAADFYRRAIEHELARRGLLKTYK